MGSLALFSRCLMRWWNPVLALFSYKEWGLWQTRTTTIGVNFTGLGEPVAGDTFARAASGHFVEWSREAERLQPDAAARRWHQSIESWLEVGFSQFQPATIKTKEHVSGLFNRPPNLLHIAIFQILKILMPLPPPLKIHCWTAWTA